MGRLTDYQRLLVLLQIRDFDEIRESCRFKVDDVIGSQNCDRESKWTESIAVGFKGFVEATKERLGIRAKGRKVFSNNGAMSFENQPPLIRVILTLKMEF